MSFARMGSTRKGSTCKGSARVDSCMGTAFRMGGSLEGSFKNDLCRRGGSATMLSSSSGIVGRTGSSTMLSSSSGVGRWGGSSTVLFQ